MYIVYLLESAKDASWYIGYTQNIAIRLKQHNNGASQATKPKMPWKIIYCECYINKADAKGREIFLKSGSGRKFLHKQLNHYLQAQI